MNNKAAVLTCVFVFVMGLIFCEKAFAQSPIENARQFQQKAINSALRSSRNQNFTAKQEYIEFLDTPVASDYDNLKKGGGKPLVNTGEQARGNTR